MSLVSHIVNDLLEDITHPLANLYDQHYGLGLLDNDLLFRAPTLLSLLPRRPLSSSLRSRANPVVPIKRRSIASDDSQFKVNLDVQQFKPEEIDVKIVDDYLVVEAKHEERADKHGFISRQFTRRYKLSENLDLDAIKSTISSDGILLITAPKKMEKTDSNVRQIPIIHTNQPALKETKEPQPPPVENGTEKKDE